MMKQKPDDLIFKTRFWKVLLHEDQYYLGRCVVVLMGEAGSISDLNPKERADYFVAACRLEKTVKDSFDSTMFNWCCLMNNAYQQKPYQPHVHWHVRPRYDHVAEVSGQMWADDHFGEHYRRGAKYTRLVNEEIFIAIRDAMRKHQS